MVPFSAARLALMGPPDRLDLRDLLGLPDLLVVREIAERPARSALPGHRCRVRKVPRALPAPRASRVRPARRCWAPRVPQAPRVPWVPPE